MVSVPALIGDMQVASLFSVSSAFEWDGNRYNRIQQLQPGQAAWIYIDSPSTFVHTVPKTEQASQSVCEGWTIVGTGVSQTVFLSQLDFTPVNYTTLFAYDTHSQSYYIPSEFEPTEGYWLISENAGTLLERTFRYQRHLTHEWSNAL
jgi:hypothetical protein